MPEEADAIEAFVTQLALLLDAAALLERTVAVERSLAHAEKLAAIGELASRIAHEIRNPVTAARSLAQLLARFGISGLRLSLPYHDVRMPAELERADYMVSSNVGRTLQACRQAVLDVRQCVDWLERRGYESIGITGTSIGSCVSFLAYAHEPRLRAGVFNHVSSYFADVVWTGISTRHVRQGFEGEVELETLRRAWLPISPNAFIHRLKHDAPQRPWVAHSLTSLKPAFIAGPTACHRFASRANGALWLWNHPA